MLPILNGILWAFLRRWYGGFNPFPAQTKAFKIFDSRGLQSLAMMICFFMAVHDKAPLWLNLVNVLWIQFQFWSRSVGEILDCGRSNSQTAASYDRWFRIPLDYVFDRLGKVKYRGCYDWWYMWLRYTLPMIVPAVSYQSWSFIGIGLMSSPVYFFFYRLGWFSAGNCRRLPGSRKICRNWPMAMFSGLVCNGCYAWRSRADCYQPLRRGWRYNDGGRQSEVSE